MNTFLRRLFFVASVAMCLASPALAATSYGYAGNAGWVVFGPGSALPVTPGATFLSGFAYAANFGWINFGDGTPVNGKSYGNATAGDFGVNRDPAGNLSGYAYAANIGWINFSWADANDPNRPRINPANGAALGFGYSANVGWINLNALTSSDTTKPVIAALADLNLEATGPGGAIATYTGSAIDDTDGPLPVTFSPLSGSVFPLGVTLVTATAQDLASNIATATFQVRVRDTTPPDLTLPANIVVKASNPVGSIVTFSATAIDLVSGSVSVSFSSNSGSLFPIGTTIVTATATDAARHTAIGTFTITVTTTAASGFASWAGGNRLTGANSAFTSDPDADGIVNLLEYFLGLRPMINDPIGLPVGSIEEDKFVFRFNRAKGVTGVTHRVLVSADLTTWTPVSPAPVLESATPTLETYVVKVPFSSARLFARLEVTAAPAVPVVTVPLGYSKSALASGAPTAPVTTAFSVPIEDTGVPAAGIRVGRIENFTTMTITQSAGGWTGNLADAAAPWAVRVTSGPAAGKLFDLTANTATTLTVSGVDLTTLGLVAGSDTFELVPMDTLFSLFGSDTLLGGTSIRSADSVLVRSGATWAAYYYDTTLGFWRDALGPVANRNHVLIRPGSDVQIVRRGPTVTLIFIGRVP